MPKRWFLVAAALGLALSAAASAQDVVRTARGRLDGKVTKVTATEISISAAGATQTLPVNEVEAVTFGEDPSDLRSARADAAAGHWEQAVADLEKIEPAEVKRPEVKADVAFLQAYCAGQLALAGQSDIAEAGGKLVGFLANYPESYHYFLASELIGELLLAHGKFAEAREYFDRVAKAPWPESKLRAAVGNADALLAEGKIDEARKAFDAVLATPAAGSRSQQQQTLARLGKSRCLAESGQTDEAIKLAGEIISKADPDDAPLLARAYLTKGVAMQKAAKPQEALFALLHVETLYSADRPSHAEALYHLVQVWQDLKKPQRALEARQILQTQYKDSRWCKALDKKG